MRPSSIAFGSSESLRRLLSVRFIPLSIKVCGQSRLSSGNLGTDMSTIDWQKQFRQVYDRGLAAYQTGRKSPDTMFNREDTTFLATIGCTNQELFDFIDDGQRYGEPDYETTLAVTSIRRDYFLNVMKGKQTGRIVSMDSLPPKAAEVDGIAWLPRLIVKARVKLRGEMPDDLMYGCAGDRPFLESMNMDLPGFLKLVWEKGDNDRAIINAVKKSAGR